jgi:hypothetical protein
MRLSIWITGFALIFAVFSTSASTQQLMQPDPQVFQRPASLCSIKGTDHRTVVGWLANILQKQGFEVNQTIWDSGEIHASKSRANGEDRVIVWIERSLAEPQSQFIVYFIGGRFEKFVGAGDLKRVLVNSSDLDSIFGSVRKAIVDDALLKG